MSNDKLLDTLKKRETIAESVKAEAQIAALPTNDTEVAISRMEQRLVRSMPDDATDADVQRYTLAIYELLRGNAKLAECGTTVLGGILTAAQLGLALGINPLGEAYLVPMWNYKTRKNEAVLIIGYKGYRKLAYNTGLITQISREVVYTNDHFKRVFMPERDLIHEPAEDEDDRGDIRGYYACVWNRFGGKVWHYMSLKEMRAHRDRFAMAKKRDGTIVGPWKDHEVEMSLKTVLLKALRDSPMSTKDRTVEMAFALDNTVRHNITSQSAPALSAARPVDFTDAIPEAPTEDRSGDEPIEGETVPEQQPQTGEQVTLMTPQQRAAITAKLDESGSTGDYDADLVSVTGVTGMTLDSLSLRDADRVLGML